MTQRYMPTNDAQFSEWVDNFVSYIGAHKAEFGLVEADLDQLLVDHPQWDGSLDDHVEYKALAKMKCAIKNDKREAIETTIKLLVQRINGRPETTDAQREALGIKPITVVSTSLPIADHKPHALIDFSGPMRHVLRIQNENSTGTAKARPAGTLGCEVYAKVGESPSGPSEMRYVGLATRNPFVVEFDETDGGKLVHYRMRWITNKQETSDWSDVQSAPIAA